VIKLYREIESWLANLILLMIKIRSQDH